MGETNPTTSKYTFTYIKPIVDGHYKILQVNWSVVGLNLRQLQDLKKIITKPEDYKDDYDEDSKFLLKIKYNKATEKPIQIFYLIQTLFRIRVECFNFLNCNTGYKVTQPNVWHPLPITHTNNDNIYNLVVRFTIDYSYKATSNTPKLHLNIDLENLLNESLFSDVTIKSTDGVAFHVHKGILAVRSDVLKAHFEHNTSETLTNVVAAPFPTDVLRQVLSFIYTDNAPEIKNMAIRLFEAADYYQIARLKKLCEEALLQGLTVENAIATLEMAKLYSVTELQEKTIEFIISKVNAKKIINTTSWKDLESNEIIKLMFEQVITKYL